MQGHLYCMHSVVHLQYNCFNICLLSTKKTVGLERGPLSLVNTTEELLDRKVAAPV
jgi:hypothetical protein